VAGLPTQKVGRSVQVLTAADITDAKPLVISVPGRNASLSVRFMPAAVLGSPQARLYSLSGELAGQASARAGEGALHFQAGHLASGVYVVVFEYSSPAHQRRRVLLKAVVLR
jgi:hypothetical protein